MLHKGSQTVDSLLLQGHVRLMDAHFVEKNHPGCNKATPDPLPKAQLDQKDHVSCGSKQ
jgi:hypothetical protein